MRDNDRRSHRVSPHAFSTVMLLLAGVLLARGSLYAMGKLEVTKVSGKVGAAAITIPPSGLTFNHKFHAETVGATCDVCHDTSTANTRFMTYPNHDTCSACHGDAIDEKSEQKNCALCHTRSDYTTSLPKDVAFFPQETFDHKLHLDNKVSCESCHTATNFTPGKANQTLPNMATCTTCHSKLKVAAATDCSTCHVKGFDTTRPADHGPLWVKTHGVGLTQTQIDSRCDLCHTAANNNDCLTCHKRSSPPQTHTLAWQLQGHGLQAQNNRQSCTVCHDQSECISCHTTNEPFSHTGLWGSPSDRHCIYCHIEGTSYVSGTVGGNCGFCHQSGDVFARHMSLPMIGHNTGSTCTNCHTLTAGVGPAIQHPYPNDPTQCVSCHQ